MNYEALFARAAGGKVTFALTGANGAYARTLLAGVCRIPALEPAVLCDLDTQGVLVMLDELGLGGRAKLCTTREQASGAAAAGQIAVVGDAALIDAVSLDILVEATGQPEFAAEVALAAIERGAHVAMVSKECDSVVGPQLAAIAARHGRVYTAVEGDQPANLVGLVTWARLLGFEVIAAGKSSEYDFVFEPASGEVLTLGGSCKAPGLAGLWELGPDTGDVLGQRAELLARLPQRATPDYCEMNVVANATGLLPSRDELSFPVCRISELADVFVPVADGGILERTGVVDVFNCLRRSDEVSFAGGVFVIVRCTDALTWEILRGKGHVVSRNGRYACIYQPYHLMGLETPLTLLSAALLKRPSGGTAPRTHAVMVARADRDFAAGELLAMGGHHHVMADCTALLLPAGRAAGLSPFYLAANKRLRADVRRGSLVSLSAVHLEGSLLHRLREEVAL